MNQEQILPISSLLKQRIIDQYKKQYVYEKENTEMLCVN